MYNEEIFLLANPPDERLHPLFSYWRDQMAERKDQCEEESRQQGSPPVSEEPVNKKFAPQYSAAGREALTRLM